MAVLVSFNPLGMTKTQYDEMIKRAEKAVAWPPKGLLVHVCYGSGETVRVVAAWEAREQFEAFRKAMGPIFQELSVSPGEPEISEIHNIIQGKG